MLKALARGGETGNGIALKGIMGRSPSSPSIAAAGAPRLWACTADGQVPVTSQVEGLSAVEGGGQ
ncbi:MAG: hypothetical protein ACRD6W_05210 [Nitrososphaerales archaeon]